MKSTDIRAIRSRRALLDASIELLLQNPNANLSQIASHAGVGRATLYRQFETREHLIQTLAMECLELTNKAMEPISQKKLKGKAALEAMLIAIMPLADRFHFLLSIWNLSDSNEQVIEIYQSQLEALSEWIEQGKTEGSITKALPTPWVVSTIDSLIYSSWWMMSHLKQTPEQTAKYAAHTLFKGIQTDITQPA